MDKIFQPCHALHLLSEFEILQVKFFVAILWHAKVFNFRLYSREVYKTTSEITDTSFIRTLEVVPRVSIYNKGSAVVNRTQYAQYQVDYCTASWQGGGTICGKGGPDMAATNSLGGPKFLLWTVRGDHMFCHGQSGGTKWSMTVLSSLPIPRRADLAAGLHLRSPLLNLTPLLWYVLLFSSIVLPLVYRH